MPRRKIAMRLIEKPRARAATYAKRTKGLEKKARELNQLCDVPVALVCAPGAGVAGARLVWESEEGVLDRYRAAAAVQPDARARHTHRSYLETELGKERAKLARARHRGCPGALPDWDAALNDVTLEEAREVLETIEAALRAVGDRTVALGLPADGEQVALVPDDDDASDDSAGMPQQLGLQDAGFGMQMMPCQCHGGNNDGGLLEQFSCDDRFLMQPGYGLPSCGGGGGGNYHVGAVDETQAPAGYGDNADYSWPDLTMGCAGPCLPAGYYYPKFVDGTLAPEEYYSAQVVTGGDYIDTRLLENPMGMDENFTNLDNNYYSAQWQAEEFQRSDDTNFSMDQNCTYLDNSYAAHWQAGEFQLSDAGPGPGQYQYQ